MACYKLSIALRKFVYLQSETALLLPLPSKMLSMCIGVILVKLSKQ